MSAAGAKPQDHPEPPADIDPPRDRRELPQAAGGSPSATAESQAAFEAKVVGIFLRGRPAELLEIAKKRSLKGEFVVLVGPAM